MSDEIKIDISKFPPLPASDKAFYERITGKINTSAERDSDGNIVNINVTWERGDTIGVTQALLDDVDPRFVQRDGDLLTIGQFKLRIIDHNKALGLYLARRIDT